jgi:hypothetical protein
MNRVKVARLLQYRDRKPFEAFQIELRSGTVLRVYHPENMTVATDAAFVRMKNGKGALFFPSEVCAIRVIGNGGRNGPGA